MMHSMVSQLIALLSQFLPLRLALFPWSHAGSHEECCVEMMLLQNRTDHIQVCVDAIIERERDRGATVLWPGSHVHCRSIALCPSCCRNQDHENQAGPYSFHSIHAHSVL